LTNGSALRAVAAMAATIKLFLNHIAIIDIRTSIVRFYDCDFRIVRL
jgi:hypothetical protein